jgi:hypothetical protein
LPRSTAMHAPKAAVDIVFNRINTAMVRLSLVCGTETNYSNLGAFDARYRRLSLETVMNNRITTQIQYWANSAKPLLT